MGTNKFRLTLLPSAQEDIEEICKYIAINLSNPSAAIKFSEELHNKFKNLCEFPESCPLVNNEFIKDKTLRKLLIDNYIAFYRLKENKLQIVRVLHKTRNYQIIL